MRELISSELNFTDGVDANIVDNLVDRIEVYSTEEKNTVHLKIYLKLLEESQDYSILGSVTFW